MVERVGITALVPPEIIYGAGASAIDVNNLVPECGLSPPSKLCAWTACWRELVLRGEVEVDSLVVVAGGDCHNALVDGQKLDRAGKRTHYLFYPFHGSESDMRGELESLAAFLGGEVDERVFQRVHELKAIGLEVDRLRSEGQLSATDAFKVLVSFSDLGGDVGVFEGRVRALVERAGEGDDAKDLPRMALVGVPPINPDLHEVAGSLGLHIVFDELPYEFVRLGGRDIDELVSSYSTYTFAREMDYRIERLAGELDRRRAEGIVHYTQYTCHHLLEDDVIRGELGLPVLTIQGDLPGPVDQQTRLRLEAFAELLGGR